MIGGRKQRKDHWPDQCADFPFFHPITQCPNSQALTAVLKAESTAHQALIAVLQAGSTAWAKPTLSFKLFIYPTFFFHLTSTTIFGHVVQAAMIAHQQQSQLHQLLRPATTAAPADTQQLSMPAAQQLLRQRNAAVAAICPHSVQPTTMRHRNTVFDEFQQDLAQLPPEMMKTAATAMLADILGFLLTSCAPEHAGTKLPDGSLAAAPHSLENAASALTTCLDELGRTGPWQPATGQGNPCRCPMMHQALQGYSKLLFQLGYAEKAAKPLTEETMKTIMRALAQAASMAPLGTLQQSLTFRNGSLLALAWATALRAHDVCKLQLNDLCTADGASLLASLLPSLLLQQNDIFFVRPYGVKNRQEANAGTISCCVSSLQLLNPLHWLHCYLKCLDRLGMLSQGYLFKPLDAGRRAYQNKPLTSSNMYAILQSVVRAAGIEDIYSTHSLRRGALQHAAKLGASEQELLDMVLITSADVLRRKYLDPLRHETAN